MSEKSKNDLFMDLTLHGHNAGLISFKSPVVWYKDNIAKSERVNEAVFALLQTIKVNLGSTNPAHVNRYKTYIRTVQGLKLIGFKNHELGLNFGLIYNSTTVSCDEWYRLQVYIDGQVRWIVSSKNNIKILC
jgi:hypothetical protein